jgi:acetyl-CoA acetyltransferase
MEKFEVNGFVTLDDKDLVQIEGGSIAHGHPYPGTGTAGTATWNLILCVIAGAFF